ncbi:YheC/YheD family protein [Bacillus pinisoli]|uniref:YheC/YheD family protein n=1 Tax=Bacillus pinisoli TaxID=2901866 RepID=UPI001FF1877A|nr:YheC/YheD family protein [Bacillus pinisoli]
MVTIGMLYDRKHPDTVKKAYAYAAAAKMEGVGFYYFSFGNVDFLTKTIVGYKYEDGGWVNDTFLFPDVIYNAGSATTDMQVEIERKLRELIPFTSHSIGNQLNVYHRIKAGEEFSQYLIPTKTLSSVETVTEMFKKEKELIINPISGRKSEDAIFVEKCEDMYRLLVRRKEIRLREEQFSQYIVDLMMINSWIVQPYIRSITNDGYPYDLRLHVQKNAEGKWIITCIYPRITVNDVVSNISKGGYTNLFEDFLKMEFHDQYYNMKRYLEHFALSFAAHFDSLYEEPLDELGIDVGVDQNNKAWIYEVNWRPGTPPTFSLELDVAKHTVLYASYIARKANEVN